MDDDISDLKNHFVIVSAPQAVFSTCHPIAGGGVSRGIAVSCPGKNSSMWRPGEEGYTADVVVVVR